MNAGVTLQCNAAGWKNLNTTPHLCVDCLSSLIHSVVYAVTIAKNDKNVACSRMKKKVAHCSRL